MRNRIAFLFALMLPVLAVAHAGEKPEKNSVVLRNVTLIDMTDERPKLNMTVVISGNRITAIGTDPAIPADAQDVDGSGKFLIPGLWDMHVHPLASSRWEWASRVQVANGITGNRVPGTGRPLAEIVRLRKDVEEGRILAPRFIANGPIIDGPPANREDRSFAGTPDEMRKEVSRLHAAGMDFIKVYTNVPRDAYFAAIEETKRLGIPLDGHVPLTVTAAEASDAGMRSIEHAYRHRMSCATAEAEILALLIEQKKAQAAENYRQSWEREDQAFRLGLESYSSGKCVELGRRFARNGTWFVPTLVEMQTRFRSEYPEDEAFKDLFKDERLRYLPAATVLQWRDEMAWNMGFLVGRELQSGRNEEAVFREREQEIANRLKMVFDLHRGGANLLAGTDADATFHFVFFGSSLHEELALFVKAGLTPMEALRTATVNPARFLGAEDLLGTIEQGKLADLVLLDANPLEDISNTTRIRAVMANGRYLDRDALDAVLAEAEKAANPKAAAVPLHRHRLPFPTREQP